MASSSHSGPPEIRTRIIGDHELREKFNSGGFIRRWKRGQLYDIVIDPGNPNSRVPGHPAGTLSQRVALVSPRTNRTVAEFHWYLRPDFAVGGHPRDPEGIGDPDPKGLLDLGVWYRAGLIERPD